MSKENIGEPTGEVIKGKFFAQGARVMKEGDHVRHERGGTFSLTVPVCEIWEHLENREHVAEMIAEAVDVAAAKEP